MSGRILLVGGTGFLGSSVAARLAVRAPAVLVRSASDVSTVPAELELRIGNLSAPLPLDGVETLVYCASMGFGHIPSVVSQLESNQVRRAVFVSTTAIFTRLDTRSRRVRLEAEQAVMNSAVEWTIVRPTMIYGTRRDRNISRLLRYLRRWPVFPMCGDGLWQPVYVEDVAAAVIDALDCSLTGGKAYNLSGAAPLAVSALLRIAAQAVGRKVTLVRVPLALALLGARLTRVVTPEQVLRLAEDKAFDHAAAARDFGFKPRSFEDGVRLEARSLGFV